MSEGLEEMKAMETWANPLLPPVFPARLELPNRKAIDVDMLDHLIAGLPPWQQELARKAFGPGELQILIPPRGYGPAYGFDLMKLLFDEVKLLQDGGHDAAEPAAKSLASVPKPSSKVPFWAYDANKSRRPRKRRGQPNSQGIA
ncbi:hypothetical protein [Rhodococcus sp. MALMAid1271]|uniref:hypothetical protein n=1 Tax=Rhodococcus sp. MALMAid1271 TaxID=3411744 RepID=UPI003BA13E1C